MSLPDMIYHRPLQTVQYQATENEVDLENRKTCRQMVSDTAVEAAARESWMKQSGLWQKAEEQRNVGLKSRNSLCEL